MTTTLRIGAAMLALVVASTAPAAQQARLSPAGLEAAALELPAGKALWHDPDGVAGSVAIVISLPLQVAYVYRAGALIGVSSVSTGKAGKETPTGRFEILQKKVFHRSNLYSNAPMPFMQRLTWDGIALHAGDNPGYPASHGCIRFPSAFARKLYDLTDMGGTVVVTDDAAVAPRGVKVPRLVPPPSSFSFGSEPVIASNAQPSPAPTPRARPPRIAAAPVAEAPPAVVRSSVPAPAAVAVASAMGAPAVPVVVRPVQTARADPAPRLVALGFEPVRR